MPRLSCRVVCGCSCRCRLQGILGTFQMSPPPRMMASRITSLRSLLVIGPSETMSRPSMQNLPCSSRSPTSDIRRLSSYQWYSPVRAVSGSAGPLDSSALSGSSFIFSPSCSMSTSEPELSPSSAALTASRALLISALWDLRIHHVYASCFRNRCRR